MDDSAGESDKKPFEYEATMDPYRPTAAASAPMMAVSGAPVLQPMAPQRRPCLFNACCCCELCCPGKVSTKVGSIIVGVLRIINGILQLIYWISLSSVKLMVDAKESKSDRDIKRIVYLQRRLPVFHIVNGLDILGFAIPCGAILIVAALRESRRLSLVYSLLSAGSAVFTLVGNVILILAVDTLQEDYFFEDGERAFVFFNTAMSVWIIVTLLVQLYCTLVGLSLYLHIKYDEDQQQVMVPYMIAPPTLSPSAVPPTMSGVYAGNDPAKQNSTTA